MKPTVGRIVNFVDYDGTILAAIITSVVWGETVNLNVFDDSGFKDRTPRQSAGVMGSVPYREPEPNTYYGGTWHWPPRV